MYQLQGYAHLIARAPSGALKWWNLWVTFPGNQPCVEGPWPMGLLMG